MPRAFAPGAARLLVLAGSAGAVVRVLGQSAPPVLPPAAALAAAEPAVAPAAGGGAAGARDAGPAEAGGLFMAKADACVVELDIDGNVVGLEMAGAGKVLAVGARKARTVNAKKFARDFATPVPTAVLTGLNGAGAAEHAAFTVEAVAFSKRRGEGKVLAFETQQTPSQARQNGPGLGGSSSTVALGACSLVIDGAATADACPLGQADFGDGCVAVCPNGQVDVGSGCKTPAADTCPTGTCITAFAATFDNDGTCVVSCSDPARPFIDGTTCVASCPVGTFVTGRIDGATCVASCPQGAPASGNICPCTIADTICAAGSICPGQTAVSAVCADRSAFSENPCACTALEQLAALSSKLQAEAPWNDLANAACCQAGSLEVDCVPVAGVKLPTEVVSGPGGAGLAGALPPSLGELGSSLTILFLSFNAIASLPTEIGALAGLVELALFTNAITSVPTDIGALTGLTRLDLDKNAITSVPTEVGALTGLEVLELADNAITSVPTELGALTGLRFLDLFGNQLTGVPAEFRTVDPSDKCWLSFKEPGFDPGFSCANVGAGTTCCTGAVFNGNNCGEGLSGGPCYAG